MVVKIILLRKGILYYGERSLYYEVWSLLLIWVSQRFGDKKISFNSCECINFWNIANIHALDVWGKRIFIGNNKIFFLCFFSFIPFAMQLFSTPVTSSIIKPMQPSSTVCGAPPFTGNPMLFETTNSKLAKTISQILKWPT